MSQGFYFPDNAKLEQVLPKTKLYEQITPSPTLKQKIVTQLEKIIWAYKLAPETINLPAQNGVEEIQVFLLQLKSDSLDFAVLTAIDKAIPSPLFFVLKWQNRLRYVSAYKYRSEPERKSVVSAYFVSDWFPETQAILPLPLALNMESLYQQLLQSIIPVPAREGENMGKLIERYELLSKRQTEIEKMDQLLQKEKQFNRKVELNRSLKQLRHEIELLRG